MSSLVRYGRSGKARDRRDGGIGAGGDDEAASRDAAVAHLQRAAIGEDGGAEQHIDPEAAEAFGRIMRFDGGDGAADGGAGLGPVDCLATMRASGGSDQRLGWHATGVEAFAAEQVPFDEQGTGTQLRRTAGGHKAGCTAADDDEIIIWGSHGLRSAARRAASRKADGKVAAQGPCCRLRQTATGLPWAARQARAVRIRIWPPQGKAGRLIRTWCRALLEGAAGPAGGSTFPRRRRCPARGRPSALRKCRWRCRE